MTKSRIPWTEHTWNPVVGCTKISPGCKNCYAERMALRLASMGNKNYEQVIGAGISKDDYGKWTGHIACIESALQIPLKRRPPTVYFVCSMGDLFHKSVPFEFIDKVFAVMALCPQHTFQILTKRPKRMKLYCGNTSVRYRKIHKLLRDGEGVWHDEWMHNKAMRYPFSHVWLGVTAENQAMADERIPTLLSIPAAVRFVSIEPMLGPVDLNETAVGQAIGPCAESGKMKCDCDCCMGIPSLDQVICGGESGPGARPMHPDWARSLRDQCSAADVPFFFKQWGEWAQYSGEEKGLCHLEKDKTGRHCIITRQGKIKDSGMFAGIEPVCMVRVGKKKAGCLLDGELIQEYPKGVG